MDPRIHRLTEAEKTLAKGNYVAAAGSVVRMIPQIETVQIEGARHPLLARAARGLSMFAGGERPRA